MKMKKYHYPAFFRDEARGFSVSFPDLPGCHTQGNDLEEAFEMAEDALTLYLYHLEETGIRLPAASDIKEMPEGTTVYVISADTLEYREIFDNMAVKKTLTIPSWMNKAAEKQGVNFSQLLQSAIKKQLSSHGNQ
jgi:antitoxin HicB